MVCSRSVFAGGKIPDDRILGGSRPRSLLVVKFRIIEYCGRSQDTIIACGKVPDNQILGGRRTRWLLVVKSRMNRFWSCRGQFFLVRKFRIFEIRELLGRGDSLGEMSGQTKYKT